MDELLKYKKVKVKVTKAEREFSLNRSLLPFYKTKIERMCGIIER